MFLMNNLSDMYGCKFIITGPITRPQRCSHLHCLQSPTSLTRNRFGTARRQLRYLLTSWRGQRPEPWFHTFKPWKERTRWRTYWLLPQPKCKKLKRQRRMRGTMLCILRTSWTTYDLKLSLQLRPQRASWGSHCKDQQTNFTELVVSESKHTRSHI